MNRLKFPAGVDLQKSKKTSGAIFFSVLRYLFLILIGYVVLYPLLYMISNAVKDQNAFLDVSRLWVPKTVTYDKFKEIWEMGHFGVALQKTLTVQVSSAFLEVISCSFAGYAMARFNYKLKRLESVLVILALLIPVQMYSLALSVTYRNIGIFDTPFVYILPSLFGVGVRGGMIIFIYRQFFEGLPKELEEAAYVDGAGPLRTFFSIALPSSGVVILTVSVLSFIWHWNESYLADLCFISGNRPLASAMGTLRELLQQRGLFLGKPEYPAYISAGCLIFIVIPLVLYMIFQRRFVRSIDRVGITG